EVSQGLQLASPPQQQTTELFLELLDRTGQCRLRDVALLGSAREVQRVGNGQKIADLVHLHAATVPAFRCARKTSVCGTWPQSRRIEFIVRRHFSSAARSVTSRSLPLEGAMDIREHFEISRTGVDQGSRQPLAGQKALVTGANSGIGKAVAIAMADAGAAVAIN